MKLIILLFSILILSSCSSITNPEDTIWVNNKLTKDQPFPAEVVGICESWVGFELLLKELGGQKPRLCYLNIASTFEINYKIISTFRESNKLLINSPKAKWTIIKPGISVNDFSHKNQLYSIGKNFKEKDLLYQRIIQKSQVER